MIQHVDDGYHIVRLSGSVIILFSNSKSCYIWKWYVYYNRLGPTYASRRVHIELFLLKYILLQPLGLLAFS